MNQDIIKMAKECGFNWFNEFPVSYQVKFERFFHMAQADMKEKCMKAIQARYMGDNNREDMEVKRCVEAIRAIGDKP